jgi:hypothetical protein
MPLRIPVALIRQVCYPTSYRLPKMAHLVTEKEPVSEPVRSYANPVYPRLRQVITGNLPNDEYRFFQGTYDENTTTATCRWCREILHSQEARLKHKGDCKVKLVELYGVLLSARHCIVCNSFTSETYWGIPLCKIDCKDQWKISNSTAFRQAVDRMKMREERAE